MKNFGNGLPGEFFEERRFSISVQWSTKLGPGIYFSLGLIRVIKNQGEADGSRFIYSTDDMKTYINAAMFK